MDVRLVTSFIELRSIIMFMTPEIVIFGIVCLMVGILIGAIIMAKD